MKLSTLLSQRPALLRQMQLANTAYAFQTLSRFVARSERAHLRGEVTLTQASPDAPVPGATLTPLAANQSIVEEHFTDEDLMELADVFAFAAGLPGNSGFEVTFRIEDVPSLLLAPLRQALEEAGVLIDAAPQTIEEPNR